MTESQARIKALDLFAGTGWGVACKRLGIKEAGVEIMPEAIATREANGMETIYHDVWDGLQLTAEQHRNLYGTYGLLIASPPCQTFSMAGHGAGRAALDEVIEAIQVHAYKDADALREFGEKHDPRTALVLTPLAYVWRDRPRLVAMEQVPTVLPVWEACAEVMREWGYDVKVEVLNAEQYGVPQTRKRAILVARRNGEVHLPTPTHSRYYSNNPAKLDPGVQKWVSMAEALGWTREDPAEQIFCPTNLRPHSGLRAGDRPASSLAFGHDRPRWVTPEEVADYKANGTPTDGVKLTADEAAVIQSYPAGRGLTDRPAPTITGGGTETGGAEPIAKYHERYTSAPGWVGSTARLTPDEAAALQSYPTHARSNYGTGGDPAARGERSIEEPASTITSKSIGVRWLRSNYRDPLSESGRGERTPDQPAITLTSKADRNKWDGERNMTADQASVLQTYEPPFVFCGTKTKQFLQIGNAVPPLLAQAVLAALVGFTPGR